MNHLNRPSVSSNGSTNATANSSVMQSQSKRFPSILVARSNLVRPSELEVCLRPHCQRQRVIEKLNGAHIVIPGQGETTLALRAYYPIDLKQQQLEEKATTSNPNSTVPQRQVLQQIHHQQKQKQQQQQQQKQLQYDLGSDNAELNGLRLFQRSFAMTIVFFVLPQDSPERQHQYDDMGSFMHRATSLLMDHQPTSGSNSGSHNNNNSNSSSSDKKKSSIRMTHVFVVQDTAQAIETIMVLVDALSTEKRLLKRAFFKRQRVANFMPMMANFTNTGNPQEQQQHQQEQHELDTVAASHAVGSFRQWASIFQLPPGEADVIMNFFGTNLQDILTATEDQLAAIPIEDRTRKLLQMFFESSPSSSSSILVGHGTTTSGGGGGGGGGAAANVVAGTFAASNVGHEPVWNGTAASKMYGGGSASFNPSFPPGQALLGTNNLNGNRTNNMPFFTGDAAMYPQSFMPMTGTQSTMVGQQSLLAAGGPPPAAMAPPTMTPSYQQQPHHFLQQQQQQQQQHGPPMTQGRRAYNGEGGATMTESTSSMYYGNNGSRFAGGGGGGGGGGGLSFLSQREQMRRWM